MGSDNFWDTVAGHQLSIEARSFENNPRALQVVKQQLAAK